MNYKNEILKKFINKNYRIYDKVEFLVDRGNFFIVQVSYSIDYEVWVKSIIVDKIDYNQFLRKDKIKRLGVNS